MKTFLKAALVTTALLTTVGVATAAGKLQRSMQRVRRRFVQTFSTQRFAQQDVALRQIHFAVFLLGALATALD